MPVDFFEGSRDKAIGFFQELKLHLEQQQQKAKQALGRTSIITLELALQHYKSKNMMAHALNYREHYRKSLDYSGLDKVCQEVDALALQLEAELTHQRENPAPKAAVLPRRSLHKFHRQHNTVTVAERESRAQASRQAGIENKDRILPSLTKIKTSMHQALISARAMILERVDWAHVTKILVGAQQQAQEKEDLLFMLDRIGGIDYTDLDRTEQDIDALAEQVRHLSQLPQTMETAYQLALEDLKPSIDTMPEPIKSLIQAIINEVVREQAMDTDNKWIDELGLALSSTYYFIHHRMPLEEYKAVAEGMHRLSSPGLKIIGGLLIVLAVTLAVFTFCPFLAPGVMALMAAYLGEVGLMAISASLGVSGAVCLASSEPKRRVTELMQQLSNETIPKAAFDEVDTLASETSEESEPTDSFRL